MFNIKPVELRRATRFPCRSEIIMPTDSYGCIGQGRNGIEKPPFIDSCQILRQLKIPKCKPRNDTGEQFLLSPWVVLGAHCLPNEKE